MVSFPDVYAKLVVFPVASTKSVRFELEFLMYWIVRDEDPLACVITNVNVDELYDSDAFGAVPAPAGESRYNGGAVFGPVLQELLV